MAGDVGLVGATSVIASGSDSRSRSGSGPGFGSGAGASAGLGSGLGSGPGFSFSWDVRPSAGVGTGGAGGLAWRAACGRAHRFPARARGATSRVPAQSRPAETELVWDRPAVGAASPMSLGSMCPGRPAFGVSSQM